MVTLYKPKPEDLWFRQEFMSDEETMAYNHAWGGAIPFPAERWPAWYEYWLVRTEGKRYYRYLQEAETGTFVGEIACHLDEERALWLADVIVDARYRGKGYGRCGLRLLCDWAKGQGIPALHDDIAADNPAIALFLSEGFIEAYRTDRIIMLRKDL